LTGEECAHVFDSCNKATISDTSENRSFIPQRVHRICFGRFDCLVANGQKGNR
jgi:hypothetical protein